MRGTEHNEFANIAATPAAFALTGGAYALAVSATFGGGSIDLQTTVPGGAAVSVLDTPFVANGYKTVTIPPGTYSLVITTATAVFASLTRIPGE
jgi:hypothetical protein